MEKPYKYYIYDKVISILFFTFMCIISQYVLKSTLIAVLCFVNLALFFDIDQLQEDFRAFKFIVFDFRKGKMMKEATLEYVGFSCWHLNWWHSHQYMEIGFREKELSGIYYVFGEDRKLLESSQGRNNAAINTRDRVRVTYFEKSKLIVSIRKI